jgi:hypothetical protein
MAEEAEEEESNVLMLLLLLLLQVAIDDDHRGPTTFPYTTQISILLQLASSPTAVDKNQKSFFKKECRKRKLSNPELPSPSPPSAPLAMRSATLNLYWRMLFTCTQQSRQQRKKQRKGEKKRKELGRKEEPIQERKPEGEKLKSRIVYCLDCRYISLAHFLLLLISRSLTSSCAAFLVMSSQNCRQRERERETPRDRDRLTDKQRDSQTDRTVNAGVRSNIS